MMDTSTIPANAVSFKDFLFKNKRNKTTLILAGIAIVIQFAVFKYFYPFASYIHGDSFSYLNAAEQNVDISTYMIGYSKLLRLFSVFSHSDFVLVAIQYIGIQLSALFCLFTIFYFYQPSKIIQYILLCFMVLNPLFLHLGNLVSSDCIFAALSITWFTLLLWIIQRPSVRLILLEVFVLFIVFTIRYNGLIYPFIAALAFILSPLSLKRKVLGIGAGILVCGLFVLYTAGKYQALTGHWQYSPFSGWQLTNNAMYAYRYVDSASRKPVPEKFQAFDHMVRLYFDSTRDTSRFPMEKMQASTFYMWSPGLPMFKYRDSLFKKDTTAYEFKKWASMGPFYKSYGIFIIKKYPKEFLEYFIWPNAKKYYAPPVEFLGSYNSGKNTVTAQAQKWFHYNSNKVKNRMKNKKVWVLDFYPILFGIINVVMLLTLLCYLLLKGWQTHPIARKGILLGSSVWLLNAVFTISASSAALRFQSFPILISTVYVALLLDWLCEVALTTEKAITPTESILQAPSLSS